MGSVWFIAEMKWLYPPIVAGRFDGKDERTWNSSHLNGNPNGLACWHTRFSGHGVSPAGEGCFNTSIFCQSDTRFIIIFVYNICIYIYILYMSYVCFSTTLLYYLGLLLSEHWGSWLHDSYVHPQLTTYWQWWLRCFGAYLQFKLKPCQTQKKSENVDKTPQFCR